VSEQDNYNWTALHFAAQLGDKGVVAALLKTGKADASVRDDAGRTAIHYAAEYGHKDVVKTLVECLLLGSGGQGGTAVSNITFTQRALISGLAIKLDTKIDLLWKLAALFPRDYLYPRFLGAALWKEGRHIEAIASYEESLWLNPLNASALRVEDVYHGGSICNCCRQKLIGIRFRCLKCYDFDLCRECFSKPSTRCESGHQFLEFPSPDWKPRDVQGCQKVE
jgi:tetratricopeptide (TPR) repeat protein